MGYIIGNMAREHAAGDTDVLRAREKGARISGLSAVRYDRFTRNGCLQGGYWIVDSGF